MANGFKTGGRQKGTPNKNTNPVCENLHNIFIDEFESGRVQEALHELEPREYIAALLKWSPFVFAKARPADNAVQPHAAGEPVANEAETTEQAQLENEERPNIQTAEAEALLKKVIGAEIERFRKHMNWTDEQMQRFVQGEGIETINSTK